MYNHEPNNYQCPFCRVAKGIEDKYVYTKQSDVFYRDDYLTAFISSHWWPNNDGNVIIIPNQHIENIYELPDDLSQKIHDFEKRISIALKEVYKCDGISTRQHNEPDGDQEIWHYHLHVFPRYKDDKLYQLTDQKYQTSEEKRLPFAEKLRKYFGNV